MDDLTDELLELIAALPVETTGRLPQLVEDAWPDLVLISLRGWARGLGRDLRRAAKALADAQAVGAAAPDDDQLGSLQECFWRIAAAVEKFDALVSLAYAAEPLRPEREKPTRLEMRPSVERNRKKLRELDSPAAEELIESRSKIGGTRAELRRNQVMHSLAPLASLDDLAPFIKVIHRDGRIMVGGYEPCRFTPARWDEGIETLAPQELFARRLLEAERALDDLHVAVRALIAALKSNGVLREPQWIWIEETNGVCTLERPASQGPPKRYQVEFVFRHPDREERRSISCESIPPPGTDIPFDDGSWRVIESQTVEDEHFDARVILIPKP
jgi:hypothetical protein